MDPHMFDGLYRMIIGIIIAGIVLGVAAGGVFVWVFMKATGH